MTTLKIKVIQGLREIGLRAGYECGWREIEDAIRDAHIVLPARLYRGSAPGVRLRELSIAAIEHVAANYPGYRNALQRWHLRNAF